MARSDIFPGRMARERRIRLGVSTASGASRTCQGGVRGGEGYRVKKAMASYGWKGDLICSFDPEKVSARRFTSSQNLVAMVSLAWALLAVDQHDGAHHLRAARCQKRIPPGFVFYSLLIGRQQ